VSSHSQQYGSCDNAPAKVDVQLDTLLNPTPVAESLPARILAKSREVARQSGARRSTALVWMWARPQ